MKDKVSRALVLGAAVLVGAIGGRVFGSVGSNATGRVGEAVADLVGFPLHDLRNDRLRHDAIRAEANRIMELQRVAIATTDKPIWDPEIVGEDFGVRSFAYTWGKSSSVQPEKRQIVWRWTAVVDHKDGWYPERCAASLGTLAPYWMEGILLKRPGTVRCSWDLATKLNLFQLNRVVSIKHGEDPPPR